MTAPNAKATSLPRQKARESYKGWPGLENPRQDDPIAVLRDVWEERRGKDWWWRWTHIGAYRAWRATRAALRAASEELSETPKRSIVELILGLPIVLLPVDPYREWLLRLPHAWTALLMLVTAGFLFGVGRRVYERHESAKAIANASALLQLVIECSRPHIKGGQDGVAPTKEHLRHTVAVFLQALADLVKEVLHLPPDVRVHANLMIPMGVAVSDDDQKRDGVGIVAYCLKRPADPSWTRVMAGDLGAGESVRDGKISVVEDTRDPRWRGIFSKTRSRCFASFPVLQGSGKVVAIVNIDADRDHVFTRSNTGVELYQTLVGAFSLLADILYNTRTGGTSHDRSGGTRK